MPYPRLAALTLATTMFAAGCGGSTSKTPSTGSSTQVDTTNVAETQPSASPPRKTKPLTRADLIAQGDAICGRLTQQLHSPSLRDNSLYTVGTTSVPEVRYYRAAFADLNALTPPAALASDWNAILADMHRIPSEIAVMGRFALDNDIASTVRVEARVGTLQQHRFAVARRDGFTDCAE